MKRSSVAHMNCSIARTLEVLGEWWTLMIVRDAFYGVRRFDDFIEDLGISRATLTDRLATLVESGIFERKRYQERPDRYEYRLSPMGRDLFPVLMSLLHWGDRWLSTPDVGGPPVTVIHVACGHKVTGPFRCDHCGEPVEPRDVTVSSPVVTSTE